MIVRAVREARQGLPTSWADWRTLRQSGLETVAGPRVSELGALRHAAVFACVSFLARVIPSLPLFLMQREGESVRKAREHPTFDVLHRRANALHTSFHGRQFLTGSLALRGNGLAFVERDGAGRTVGYLPVRWDQVTVEIEGDSLVYIWQPTQGEPQTWRRDQVLHVMGLSTDGVKGLSPIAAGFEAVGWGLAMQEHGARFFGQGTTPSGVLTHPENLTEPAQDRLQAQMAKRSGTSGAWKTLVLEEGMKWEAMGISPKDSQLLDSRQFSAIEICSFFGIDPHLVGYSFQGAASFASLEQLAQELVYFTLDPILSSLEQSYERDFLTEQERERGYFIKHNVDALLRGDARTRAEVQRIRVMTGIISRNEARAQEDLDPEEGLDEFLVAMNMAEVGEDGPTPVGGGRDPQFQPQPPAPPPPERGAQRTEPPRPSPAAAVPPPASERRAEDEPAFERRARVAARFRPLLEAAGTKILRAELAELRRLADRHVPPPPQEGEPRGAPPKLVDWLVSPATARSQKRRPEVRDLAGFVAEATPLYQAGDGADVAPGPLHALVERELVGPLETLTETIFDLAAEEIPGQTATAGLGEFVSAVAASAVAGWAIHSLRALEALVATDVDPAAAPAAVDAIFERWAANRAQKTARRESVKASRAASREAYRRSGATTLRWRTRGDTCPFCAQFEGVIVAIEGGTFAQTGDRIEAEGQPTLTVTSSLGHPPLHRGCDCEIEPGP